jgi:hypothetical protein
MTTASVCGSSVSLSSQACAAPVLFMDTSKVGPQSFLAMEPEGQAPPAGEVTKTVKKRGVCVWGGG